MSAVRTRLLRTFEDLDRMHRHRGWHWWPDADPFEVIVGTILVQNTAWTNVEVALANLRRAGLLRPERMAATDEEALRRLVHSSGQYRQKARKLREFLSLVRKSGGLEALLARPAGELRVRLLGTWGIGEETADAIILYAARQAAFVVDAYTVRLFGRLGLGPPSPARYRQWQAFFEDNLYEDDAAARRELWARYHALVVLHCKHLCRKSSPRCRECLLATRCRGPEPGP